MPGAIDMHAHFEGPGHTEREDFTTGTMAAAAGGITTVFEHPLTYPPVTRPTLYREKREMARSKVVVDFGLWGALTAPSIPEIAGQWREGAVGFKAFMPVSDPSYPHVTDAEFLEGMRAVRGGRRPRARARRERLAAAGVLARMRAAGPRDPLAHHESRPPFVEEEAVHRALYLAAHAGVRIQIVHVSSPVSAELVRGQGGGPAGDDGDLPAPPAARPGRPRAARPLWPLRPRVARPAAGRAAVGLRARRDGGLPRLGPLRVHDRGEGARLAPTSSPRRSAAR